MRRLRSPFIIFSFLPLAWYIFFLLIPLALVLATSFAQRGLYGGMVWNLNFDNYIRVFDWVYLRIFLRSLTLALITSLICFLISFPLALLMATASIRRRQLMVLAIAIPFLTNLIIRVGAIKVVVSSDGFLERLLTFLQVPHNPYALSDNFPLVMLGMASTYLPFMVFPIYGALERFDFSLVEAAKDLGAHYGYIIFKVLLPNLRRAIASGLLLVFIPSLGDFVIPDLLGGAKTMLIGNLISEQFLKSRDWPFGSALAVILALIFSVAIYFIEKYGGGKGVTRD